MPAGDLYRLFDAGMNLNKKQKIYGGLLILAVAAVFVDQVIIGSDVGTPHRASAQPVKPQPSAGGQAAVVPAGAGSFVPDTEQLITNRLAGVARDQGVDFATLRDGFEPPEAWVGKGGSVQLAAGPEMTAQEFQQRYPLMAVITTGGQSYAVVGDQTLRVGQVLHGFKLVAVKKRKVLFELDGAPVVLTLATQQ